jgi:hypothetical protein
MTMRGRGSRYTPGSIDTLSAGGGSGGLGAAAPLILVGAGFIVFWLICLMTQVSTNEAWNAHATSLDVYTPNWGVFLQIPMLILGQIQASQTSVVVFAWGIELIFLGITFGGFELIHRSVHQSGRILGIFFEIVAFGAVCYNWYTDYHYGTISPGSEWGHAGFAFITSIVVAYFGVIGLNLIRAGWARA